MDQIASGAVTATQIEAAYEPLNEKLDGYEAEITDFIYRLLAVAGVQDKPTYTRSIMVNQTETINAVMNSALVLDEDYMTEKIMTVLGDKDKVQDVLCCAVLRHRRMQEETLVLNVVQSCHVAVSDHYGEPRNELDALAHYVAYLE